MKIELNFRSIGNKIRGHTDCIFKERCKIVHFSEANNFRDDDLKNCNRCRFRNFKFLDLL